MSTTAQVQLRPAVAKLPKARQRQKVAPTPSGCKTVSWHFHRALFAIRNNHRQGRDSDDVCRRFGKRLCSCIYHSVTDFRVFCPWWNESRTEEFDSFNAVVRHNSDRLCWGNVVTWREGVGHLEFEEESYKVHWVGCEGESAAHNCPLVAEWNRFKSLFE